MVVVRPVAVGALAEAAVDIVANLDTFEPDLRRKLDAVMNRVGKDVQKRFDTIGAKSGKSFADAVGKAASASGAFDDVGDSAERMQRTTVTATKGMSDGFKLPLNDVQKLEAAVVKASDSQADALGKVRVAQTQLAEARKKSGAESSAAIAAEERLATAQRNAARDSNRLLQVTEALVSARENAFRNAGESAGEAAGDGFGDGFRKTANRAAGDGGDDAGGFFARAFETAASRAIGTGMLRVFGAGLAALVTSATPLSTILGGAAAAVVALTAAIVQATGASVALLGILGSLGLVAGTLKVGFQGVGDAMKAQTKALEELRTEGEVSAATQEKLDAALKNLAPSAAAVVVQLGAMQPAWEAVRRVVQGNLFAGVSTALANLGNRFLPILSQQLGTAAQTINAVVLGLSRMLNTSSRAGQITSIFSGLNQILATLAPIITPLTGAFLNIFEASLPFAQQLASTIASLSGSFSTFLNEAVAGGGFQAFMEGAFVAASDLFRLLGNIGRIIGTVFSAGQEAGGNLLDTLANLTGHLAQFLQSATGQSVLASFFGLIAQAGQILVGVFQTLSPLLSGISALFDALRPALQTLGTALIPVVAQLATALGSALTQLAPLLAQLVVALTPLVTTILSVLVTQFQSLLPVIVAIVAGIIPLVQALVAGLVPAFQALTPIAAQLAPILVQVVAALVAGLLPAIQAITPILPMLVTSVVQLVLAFVSLLPSLIPLIGPAAQLSLAFTQLLLALAPLIPPLVQIAVITISQLAPALTAIVGFIIPVIASLVSLTNTVTRVVTAIVGFVSQALSLFAQLRSGGADQISALVGTIVGLFGGMVSSVLGQLSGWLSSAVAIAGKVGTGIVSAVKSGLSGLAAAFSGPFEAARAAVSGAIERIVGVVSGAVGRIQGLVSQITGALGKIKLPGGIGNIDIPGFARGGIVDRPTLGVFGEAGREALIPLTNEPRAAELMDKSGLTQFALERALGNASASPGGKGRTREIHMPVTIAGLTKEETIQILKEFLENTFGGARIGLDLGDGVTL